MLCFDSCTNANQLHKANVMVVPSLLDKRKGNHIRPGQGRLPHCLFHYAWARKSPATDSIRMHSASKPL